MQTQTQAQRMHTIDRKYAWPNLKRIVRRDNEPLPVKTVRMKDLDHHVYESTVVTVRDGERLIPERDTNKPTLCAVCQRPVEERNTILCPEHKVDRRYLKD